MKKKKHTKYILIIGIKLWKRAARYVKAIMDMEENRWPIICLREEIRGIANRNPTKWGKDFKMAMDEVGKIFRFFLFT